MRTVDLIVCNTFKEACQLRGLLDDDREWIYCLRDAVPMSTGYQLRSLFVVILLHCEPISPQELWDRFKHSLCDDLRVRLINHLGIPEPTEDQILDYGLYCIGQLLRKNGRSLADFHMPVPDVQWHVMADNQLIAEQLDYNVQELQAFVDRAVPTLNEDQRAVFDAVVEDALSQDHSHPYFVHSAGGCGKTYLCKLIATKLRAERKIVLCVASSGIASLLLPGGRTAHSRLKIPISVNEDSTCSITKGDPTHQLLQQTSLIICDEIPMLHRHNLECLDRSLRDLLNKPDVPFGGITMLFGGDFRQTLPVVPHGSREQIVGATFCRSRLWGQLRIFHLRTNMRLGQDPDSDAFAAWLLDIGAGRGLAADSAVSLPDHMRCPENTPQSLIDSLYSDLLNPDRQDPLPDSYFLDRTILSAKNADVDNINTSILESLPGEKKIFTSADSLAEGDYDYIPIEFLHTLTPSGFPLHKLEVKKGVPLMLLRNLNPSQGLYNGTRMILVDWTNSLLKCRILREDGNQDDHIVLIPRMSMRATGEDNPIPLKRRQFPVRLAFSMTINKSQGQSVKWVGLDLRSPVFSHGQLYVALSRCTHPNRVKAIFPEHEEGTSTINIVYREVFRGFEI